MCGRTAGPAPLDIEATAVLDDLEAEAKISEEELEQVHINMTQTENAVRREVEEARHFLQQDPLTGQWPLAPAGAVWVRAALHRRVEGASGDEGVDGWRPFAHAR